MKWNGKRVFYVLETAKLQLLFKNNELIIDSE